jgi:hypothetical protein
LLRAELFDGHHAISSQHGIAPAERARIALRLLETPCHAKSLCSFRASWISYYHKSR